jgi:tetratricopeptide (TPR) repeat protein
MKTLVLTITILFSSFQIFANSAFEKAMRKNLDNLKSAKTLEELVEVANSFERIAANQPNEWLPSYYCAYTNVRISNLQKTPQAKDDYLDKAQTHLDNALKTQKDDSEITALQGFILMMKVSVDPANRGQTLSPKVSAIFEKAIKLNPSNPRALFLIANWEYGMAKFFNGDTSNACRNIIRALELFESEAKGEFDPAWGKEMALAMVKACQ